MIYRAKKVILLIHFDTVGPVAYGTKNTKFLNHPHMLTRIFPRMSKTQTNDIKSYI